MLKSLPEYLNPPPPPLRNKSTSLLYLDDAVVGNYYLIHSQNIDKSHSAEVILLLEKDENYCLVNRMVDLNKPQDITKEYMSYKNKELTQLLIIADVTEEMRDVKLDWLINDEQKRD